MIWCGVCVSFLVKANAAFSFAEASAHAPSRAATLSSVKPATASLSSWWPSQYKQWFARDAIQNSFTLNVLSSVMAGSGSRANPESRRSAGR